MKKTIFTLLAIVSLYVGSGQTNIIYNGGFETYTACPSGGAQWNVCDGWNNVNLNQGAGAWGTPDYFNTCGSGGANPPATFAGTCNPHLGSAMMALVVYNVPYPDYREYLSAQLNESMVPGNTYTLSFWLSNGTGIKSPWTIKNIGAHFSTAPLNQSGWGLINATPQCEITSNVISNNWTQYTFTVNPTSNWSYITIGAFRTDSQNNPTQSFTNPGGPTSAYANYFVDDISLMRQNSLVGINETIKNNERLMLYPNPAKDIIQITNSKRLLNKSYIITNSFGQVALKGTFTEENPVIDIHNLSQGIFDINIAEGSTKMRFIKE